MKRILLSIGSAGAIAAAASLWPAAPAGATHEWEKTRASWYKGRRGACGRLHGHYAAHRTLPCGTRLRVSRGDRSITVEILDRGPYVKGRGLDLSKGAFEDLASPSRGVVAVKWKKTVQRRR